MFTYVCIWPWGEVQAYLSVFGRLSYNGAKYLIMELNILMELNIWHIILEKRHARQLLSP